MSAAAASEARSEAPRASRRIVLKLGGEVAQGEALAAIAIDVAALARSGVQVAIVHGGGPQATKLQEALGQTPKKIAGRRVTDEATLDVIKMVVAGKLNVDICAALGAAHGKPVGLHGASGLVIEAEKRPPKIYAGAGPDPIDLGFVGDVVRVNVELLELLFDAGFVPVLACVGANDRGEVFNINADTVANKVATSLSADGLFVVSDVPGVLREVSDPSSRVSRLTVAEGRALIASGVASGGMIPKLEECFAALAAGVKRIHIVGRLRAGDLEREARDPGSVGTALSP